MGKFLIPAALVAAVVLLLAVFIGFRARSRRRRGRQGESEVARRIQNHPGRQYLVNDILFEPARGQSCQIDHVLVLPNGIWVIETKNYSGEIVGDADSRDWMQILGRGDTRHTFYNPVMQNRTHVFHLSDALCAKGLLFSAVVFLSDANLKNLHVEGVYSISQIDKLWSADTGVRLSPSQMKGYYKKLKRLKRGSGISERQHVRNIKRNQKLVKKGICPRCGGKLVPREGGKFYGCSNFPKCKFKKDIE